MGPQNDGPDGLLTVCGAEMHHRIYIDTSFESGATVKVEGDEFHHATRVVRIRDREPVELFDGKGKAAAGHVVEIEKHSVTIVVDSLLPSREPKADLTLALALIQPERFEFALQKATELGTRRFIPLVTERVEVRPDRYRGKQERWEKIVLEAVKQCGRAMLPELDTPHAFEDVITQQGLKLFFDAEADQDAVPSPLESATLFIGPEGGWSDRELRSARENGCRFVRLGARRLRAETAAIAAITKVAIATGDL